MSTTQTPPWAVVPALKLADIEQPLDRDGGSIGRGTVISKSEAASLKTEGYKPLVIAGSTDFPICGCDGSPTIYTWRAFVRQTDEGEWKVAAIEFPSL